jgi:hypothetical protein
VQKFPTELIVPLDATFTVQEAGLAAIEVILSPFSMAGETVATSLRLDRILVDASDVRRLAGQAMSFPVNPTPGYIDGSIYLDGEHVPFDVTRLKFGVPDHGGIPVEITGNLAFSAICLDTFEDAPMVLATVLKVASGS